MDGLAFSAKSKGRSRAALFHHHQKPAGRLIIRNALLNNRALNNINKTYLRNANRKTIGDFTREVSNAIGRKLEDSASSADHTDLIPLESVQSFFNNMRLYPSKNQVLKMVQMARQCSRPNASEDYLTFGEFCVFLRTFQSKQLQNNRNNCQVFLGGSCNPTTWRADTAIPELQKHGISFYNPQVSTWAPELVAQEHEAKQAASVLLFVIDSQTRSTVGMIEVAFLVASGRCVVVVAQPYTSGQSIMGEKLTECELEDLQSAQSGLLSLVTSRGVKIHSNLTTALDSTAKIVRNCTNDRRTTEPQVELQLKKYREVYDSCNGNVTSLPEVGKLLKYLPGSNGSKQISFDKFCMLMAEMAGVEQSATSPDGINNNLHGTHDVFLGGSLRTHNAWRRSSAVLLEKHGISYYNPAVRENSHGNNLIEWTKEMDNSKVLLFYITNDARSMSSMILAAHFMGTNKKLVLCVENLPEECRINNQTLSKFAVKDYNRARVYISDVAKRKNCPVFDNITEALHYTITLLGKKVSL